LSEAVRLDVLPPDVLRGRALISWSSTRVLAARVLGNVVLVGGTLFYGLLICALVVSPVASTMDDAPYQPDYRAPDPQPLPGGAVGLVVALLLGIVLYIPVGVRLLRYGRQTVLYLRKFRDEDGAGTVTAAMLALGGRWRVITLDDESVTGQGPDRRELDRVTSVQRLLDMLEHWSERGGQRSDRIMGWFRTGARLNVGVLVAVIVSWMTLPAAAPFLAGLFIAGTLALVAAGCLALVLPAVPTLLNMGLLPVSMALRVPDPMQSGDERPPDTIYLQEQVPDVIRRLRRLNRRVLAPQLSVLRAAPSVWQPAVLGLAGISSVGLVDVSIPTPNILWEIRQIRDQPRIRCIAVGQQNRLEEINAVPAETGGLEVEIRRALQGLPVLAYRPGEDGAAFARAIRSMLTA
jgi:hypothetical protein